MHSAVCPCLAMLCLARRAQLLSILCSCSLACLCSLSLLHCQSSIPALCLLLSSLLYAQLLLREGLNLNFRLPACTG